MSDESKPAQMHIAAPEYLRLLFQPSDRLSVLIRNSSRRETIQRIAATTTIAESSFQAWLRFKNEKQSSDIYIGMNPLTPAARTRTKEDILLIRHLYIDLDHDAPKSLAAIERSNLIPPPNFLLRTSPNKFQVVWRVEQIAQDQAETLLRILARKFGGDPAATDSTRVLRLPGFANKKYEQDFVVSADQRSTRVYHAMDFKLRIDFSDFDHRTPRRTPARTASSEPQPLSQSEYDWAFAKRALARGEEPEDVIRQIARFRAGDKSDPDYYARHTVTKALREIEGRQPNHHDDLAEDSPVHHTDADTKAP
jgi:hypothetical protein